MARVTSRPRRSSCRHARRQQWPTPQPCSRRRRRASPTEVPPAELGSLWGSNATFKKHLKKSLCGSFLRARRDTFCREPARALLSAAQPQCSHRGHHTHRARPPAPRSLLRRPPGIFFPMAVPRRDFFAQSPRRQLKSTKTSTTALMFAVKVRWLSPPAHQRERARSGAGGRMSNGGKIYNKKAKPPLAGSALSEPTPATPAERAPSRERVVVPTERRRLRRACADRAVDTRTRTRRVVCAVCRVTSPRLLRCIAGSALSEPTPATPAERAPSRERVVVPTERRRLCRACADRAVDTRTRTRRVVCAVCRVTSPRLLRCDRRLGSVRANTGDARRASAEAASESSCRPSAAGLVVRAPIAPSTHARAVSCAPSCVE